MDNDNTNDNTNNSFNSHPLTSDNNSNNNNPHGTILRHSSSNPSEFHSESITDAHFSPVAVAGSRSSSGSSTSETHHSFAQSSTATTTIVAIDSLVIASPPSSSSSTNSRPKKVAKRGAQMGSTFTFPSISAAANAQGVSASPLTLSTTTSTTTMTATVSVESAAASAVTSSILTIPTNTATAAVSRPMKTGRHNRGERMTFELDDVLREYTPDQFKTCKAYDVGGVNILNKKPVDSKTALDKIKRRRETHNRVERRRRDCINQLIDELTALLPKEDDNDTSKSHRVNILRTAIAHIQNLTRQNENLQQQVDALKAGRPMPPPAIITTLAPTMDYDDSETAYSENLPSPASASYSAYSPSSPLSPSVSAAGGGAYSPLSSPGGPLSPYHPLNPSAAHGRGTYQDWTQPPGQLNSSSGEPSTSYSNETTASTTASMPDIPMIVEPSEQISTPELGSLGTGSKRLNRHTLPRLQLAPPPFHQHSQHHNQHQQQQQPQGYYQQQHHAYQQQHYHDQGHLYHRGRSNSGGGYPQSPSYYGHDSASATSPNSTHSDYSSSTGPWSSSSGGPYSAGLGSIGGGRGGGPESSTSSSFGTSPRSPHFSTYGPPSPYSPYGPSSAHAQMSPSPGFAPWNAMPSSSPSTVPHPSGGAMQDHSCSPRP
ncbi:hypothetical protein F5H01DRAFT_414149 [Linnemannia elongata]|nr:hypothetical protein F5H01DRAFT_414149 [Linnemannia elongata]